MSTKRPRTYIQVSRDRAAPYELIKQAILNGEFAPGQTLTENWLAERLSVSRTPIREALTRLEQDGLAQRTNMGLIVRERSPEEVLDIYDTRCVLEGMAARVAAERRTEYDLHTLERLNNLAAQIDPANPKAMAEHNHDFHLAVWRASHNETVLDLLQHLDLHLHRYPETTLSYPGRWQESLEQHRLLGRAIRERNLSEAQRLAAEHFQAAREIRLKLWYEEGNSA